MSALDVRLLASGDVPAVVALSARVPTAPHWPPAEFARMAELVAAEPTRRGAWVALTPEAALAGFAVARRGVDDAELESIVTSPELLRHGVGTALLARTLQWAARTGAAALLLECRASNTPALALYARFGFVEEGRRPRYYRNPEEAAVLMRRSIPPDFTI